MLGPSTCGLHSWEDITALSPTPGDAQTILESVLGGAPTPAPGPPPTMPFSQRLLQRSRTRPSASSTGRSGPKKTRRATAHKEPAQWCEVESPRASPPRGPPTPPPSPTTSTDWPALDLPGLLDAPTNEAQYEALLSCARALGLTIADVDEADQLIAACTTQIDAIIQWGSGWRRWRNNYRHSHQVASPHGLEPAVLDVVASVLRAINTMEERGKAGGRAERVYRLMLAISATLAIYAFEEDSPGVAALYRAYRCVLIVVVPAEATPRSRGEFIRDFFEVARVASPVLVSRAGTVFC